MERVTKLKRRMANIFTVHFTLHSAKNKGKPKAQAGATWIGETVLADSTSSDVTGWVLKRGNRFFDISRLHWSLLSLTTLLNSLILSDRLKFDGSASSKATFGNENRKPTDNNKIDHKKPIVEHRLFVSLWSQRPITLTEPLIGNKIVHII